MPNMPFWDEAAKSSNGVRKAYIVCSLWWPPYSEHIEQSEIYTMFTLLGLLDPEDSGP